MGTNSLNLNQLRLKSQEDLAKARVVEVTNKDIAMIGIYTHFPMAGDTDEFWDNMVSGVSCVSAFPVNRKQDTDRYVRFSQKHEERLPYSNGAFLEHIDEFDYSFFNIPPQEASLMNPRHRLFLQAAWNVVEDAGYSPQQVRGSNMGVYMGHISDMESYLYREMIQEIDPSLLPASIPGNLSSITPSRISYLLNLKGPSLIVDTACSSSLVAIDLACQALRRGDCDSAIVGAVRINLLPQNKEYSKLGIESSDDETRAFDDHADGSGMGEGVAAVLLKPLNKAIRDGDHIYCTIKGSATNQDGASMGITAPNPSAQTDVLVKAWKDAGIDPTSISYIETHGTATKLGDPIEIEGITAAFQKYTDKKQFCAIGSVKTNIGHLYDCAGLAGLIKGALALKNQVIPPNPHFMKPNQRIPFADSPVYVNTHPKPWEEQETPRRCGVSSFGLSGTNCHVVLEEYIKKPDKPERIEAESEQGYVFVLSAKSETSLRDLLQTYSDYSTKDQTAALKDICYTAAMGRDHYPIRLAMIVRDMEDWKRKIRLLTDAELSELDYPWFSYGMSREADRKENLTEQGRELLQQWHSAAGAERESLLMKAAALYTAGADLDWAMLFRGSRGKKVSLPTYFFERKRCWLQIPEISRDAEKSDLFYSMEWFPEAAGQQAASLRGETILVMGGKEDVIEQLVREGADYIQVKQGNAYQALDSRTYMIGDLEEDYSRLVEDIKHRGISRVLHLFSYGQSQEIRCVEDLANRQNTGVHSLFYLTKALLNSQIRNDLDILIATDYVSMVTGSESCIKPENAPLIGLGKVIGIEYPHLSCRAIDLDDYANAQTIISELKNKKNTYHIAYREGKRFAERMRATDIKSAEDQKFLLREEGVYVITGGAGNLGLLTAKHLASKGNINLALINRTPLPERSMWEEILSNGKDAALCAKLQVLKEIGAAGTHVDCMALDVASLADMSQAMDHLRQKYGRINGVIHAAGIPGRGFLISKERPLFDAVLAPKVTGTWILDQVTEQDDLDFFVMFSSGVSLCGEMGQGDYTAANSYLDAFADYRRKKGKPAQAINWVVWEGARMAEGKSAVIDDIFKPLPASQALEALTEVISKNITRVLIGELNEDGDGGMELFSQNPAFHLPEQLVSIIERGKKQRARKGSAFSYHTNVKLSGKDHGNYSEIETTIAGLYREVLGYQEMSIHDSFFELGGDSIQLHRLYKLVDEKFPGQLSIADLFAYSSILKLAAFLTKDELEAGRRERPTVQSGINDDIAIIGMAAKFPSSSTVEEYWNNIKNAVDCMKTAPAQRREYVEQYLSATARASDREPVYMDAGYVDDVDEFDYRFFKISPKEAGLTDPTQRLFMQTAWSAIEDAGYGGEKLRGSRTGIYVGFANIFRDSYQKMLMDVDPTLMGEAIVGNVSAMIPTRISHLLDLKGPTMVVDTACSSALVAVHMASNAIRNGDCDTALVGGIKLFLIPIDQDHYKIGIEANDGKTRAFDNHSDGAGAGEGTGVIMLKPLSRAKADGDYIHAVIKGSAINQDGASMGITAPNPQAQTEVILQAWEKAGIHPESIAFIEAHGTGTVLGDPIEISGLKQAMEAYTDKKQFCAIGSVKSNVGHLNEGAGMASIIKAVMSLKNKEIPPTLYFQNPNRKIDFYNSPLFINTHPRRWESKGEPMRCAISSFGLSGTNCHMIIEEYVADESADEQALQGSQASPNILTLSAASFTSLQRLVDNYVDYDSRNGDEPLQDICYTANTGRGHYSYRIAMMINSREDLRAKLEALSEMEEYGNITVPGIYYGVHRIVSSEYHPKGPGDITEGEKREMSRNAGEFMLPYKNTEVSSNELEGLCRLYVKGADIPWEQLYRSEGLHRKVQLPSYPFEKSKCWFSLPKEQKEQAESDMNGSSTAFRMGWESQELTPNGHADSHLGTIAVIKDERGWSEQLTKALRASGNQVLEWSLPDMPRVLDVSDDERLLVKHFRGLLEPHKGIGIAKVIHCSSLSKDSILTISDLEASQQKGAISLFLLTKAWAEAGFEYETEFILVSDYVHQVTGEERVYHPENAPLFGFGKALPKEYGNLKCRSIDIDDQTKPEVVLSELMQETSTRLVAYRNGQRYVEMFEQCDSEGPLIEGELEVTDGGVYLITGGTGGIGLETAKLLASKGNIKLVLVNRSAMPNRNQWDEILTRSDDSKLSEKIESIREIETKGSQVIFYQADVAQADQMAAMLDEIRSLHGPIKGIVHGAGWTKPEPIAEKSLETYQQVIAAKIYGTWLLDQLTADDRLDFFLMYSSVSAMFEAGFQSDYIAANAYLDSYSAMPSKDGRKRLTVLWTTWKDKGMAADNNFQTDTIFKTITSDKAMKTLNRIWSSSPSRVLIGELNVESKMALWLNNYAIRLSKSIRDQLETVQKRLAPSRGVRSVPQAPVKLIGGEQDSYSETEQLVAQVCRDVLGYEEIDIHENFFEMGADSLIIRQIYQHLNKRYPVVMVTDLFEYPTIHKLSRHVIQKSEDGHKLNAADTYKANDPKKSLDEELNRMFDDLDNGTLSIEQVLGNLGRTKWG